MNELDLFAAAIAVADPTERAALLERECTGHPEMRQRIDRLLIAHFQDESVLDPSGLEPLRVVERRDSMASANGTANYDNHGEHPGGVIDGKYTLVEIVGQGGMGSVWRAKQTEPVKRFVAVKLIKAGMDSKQVLARFNAERQALALMDHPNIAKVLDGGLHQHRPYFVMELVKGMLITEYCDKCKLAPKERLELFVPVCQAIQHAHQKGIIHRDIKPSNVLVAMYDDKPVVKVIDFGVAKATGGELTEATLDTGFGAVVGTPQYMSPEQATFNNLDIDTRTDVYALGVLLYELLTGSTPFSRKELEKKGLLEMLRVVREEEPQRPSTKLSSADALPTLSANRSTEPKKLTGLLKNELDWIVMKALEKDRTRRYETANGFAADVQRYLGGEAVQAHPPSAAYRFKKFIRRNKSTVFAASLVLLTLIGGMVGTSWAMMRAEASRHDAEIARDAERLRAEGERHATQSALLQKARAEKAEADTLADYRAATDNAIEQLIGSKTELGPREKAYLENTLQRWQAYANRQGDDEHSRAIQAEGRYRVGFLWTKLGQNEQAAAEFEQAEMNYQRLANDFPSVVLYRKRLAGCHGNRAFVLDELGKNAEAQALVQSAIAILEKLTQLQPNDPNPEDREQLANMHNNLASLFESRGNRTDAERHYLKTVEVLERLAEAFPNQPEHRKLTAACQNNLGRLMMVKGKLAEAEGYYQRALATKKELVAEFPMSVTYRRALGTGHHSLANCLEHLGRSVDSEEQYREAITIQQKLSQDFPAVSFYHRDLAATFNRLGELFAAKGNPILAEQQLQLAISILENIEPASRALPDCRKELSDIDFSVGVLMHEQQRWDEADKYYGKSILILEGLVAEFPLVPSYQVSLGADYCNCGLAATNSGKPKEGLIWLDKAIKTLSTVYQRDPAQVDAQTFLRDSHLNRAQTLELLMKYSDAIKDWDLAIELGTPPQKQKSRISRTLTLYLDGQYANAVVEIEALTALDRTNPAQSQLGAGDWYNFACIYSIASIKVADKQKEYGDQAIAMLRQSVKAGFQSIPQIAKDTDLNPLRDREDFKALLAELDREVEKK